MLNPSPFRRVVSWEAGAGSDRLKLKCGHTVIRDHRATEPKKARCHTCRDVLP